MVPVSLESRSSRQQEPQEQQQHNICCCGGGGEEEEEVVVVVVALLLLLLLLCRVSYAGLRSGTESRSFHPLTKQPLSLPQQLRCINPTIHPRWLTPGRP